jgi:hypothetical protein
MDDENHWGHIVLPRRDLLSIQTEAHPRWIKGNTTIINSIFQP